MDEKKLDVLPENAFKLTDIRITAFLLSFDEQFELMDVQKKVSSDGFRQQQKQCVFVILNKSSDPVKQWILDYQSGKGKVSARKYNQKLDDLRDMINSVI